MSIALHNNPSVYTLQPTQKVAGRFPNQFDALSQHIHLPPEPITRYAQLVIRRTKRRILARIKRIIFMHPPVLQPQTLGTRSNAHSQSKSPARAREDAGSCRCDQVPRGREMVLEEDEGREGCEE
eukprot:scaffold16550_cov115-Isochrysis_galbana.AAC.1